MKGLYAILVIGTPVCVYTIYNIKKQIRKYGKCMQSGFPGLIGNTPMIQLRTLSEATGCTILVKCT